MGLRARATRVLRKVGAIPKTIRENIRKVSMHLLDWVTHVTAKLPVR